jgi:hypothetical protein
MIHGDIGDLAPAQANSLMLLCADFLARYGRRQLLLERAMQADTRAEEDQLLGEYESIFGASGIDAIIARIAAAPATSEAEKHLQSAVLALRGSAE